MGGQPPYLYDAPRRESAMGLQTTFNPKAVTMASRQPPPSPKKKQEGPFISFNQHPDSYLILPYGNTNVKSMSPKTKTAVKVVRWIQFVLRLLSLFGALGVVLCAIFIRGAADTEGYIMRIAVRFIPAYLPSSAADEKIAWRGHCVRPLCNLPPSPKAHVSTCCKFR